MNVPRRAVVDLIILMASLILCLLALEVAIRLFVTVRNVGPVFSEYDPVYQKRLKASLDCERVAPEFTMHITTNPQRHRGPEAEERPGAVWCLGDSFTEGYGVNDGEDYPALLRAALRANGGPPVVNAGIGDVGDGRWIKFLRNEAPALHPGLIVFEMTGNDFNDNAFEKMYRLLPDGTLAENPVALPGWSRTVQRVIDAIPFLPYSYTLGALEQMVWITGRGTHAKPGHEDPAKEALTYAIVTEIVNACEEKKFPLVMILVGLTPDHQNHVEALARARGVPVMSAPPKDRRPDLYYKIDEHWNAAGHRWAASALLPEIRNQISANRVRVSSLH